MRWGEKTSLLLAELQHDSGPDATFVLSLAEKARSKEPTIEA
jgi:hypothetical protein